MRCPKNKRLQPSFVATIAFILMLSGCADNPESDEIKVKVDSKEQNYLAASLRKNELAQGDSLEISLPGGTLADSSGSWNWSLDDAPCENRLSTFPALAMARVSTDSLKMGLHRLKINYTDTHATAKSAYLTFRIHAAKPPISLNYRVVNTYPHETDAYTQGLIFRNGVLWESTGLKGRSSLRRVDLETGVPLQTIALESQYFAEGLTIFNNQLIQLTWQNRVGLVYDLETMELLKTFRYGMEGWGLTHDSTQLYLSDGSSNIYRLDPVSFQLMGTLEVCDNRGAVSQLNELEFHNGLIWANIYGDDRIIAFNPNSGEVVYQLDLSDLYNWRAQRGKADVLNGIAVHPKTEHLLVTGKLWPNLYELEWFPLEP